MANGERVAHHLCAGCCRPLNEAPTLDLIDGSRLHDAAGHACLIRWSEHWREAATRVLLAMGLPPSADDGGAAS
jgi:hypothetical protein